MSHTVLLAGSTGMFGHQVGRSLLEVSGTYVKVLVRKGWADDAEKQKSVGILKQAGAEVVEGDLADTASLDRATRGVDVIVSAVQGGPEVIIDGQAALAEAGKRNGVRRILPSDYALDFFKATPGEHMMFDLRRKAAEAIAAVGIEHVHVLQGAFMEMFGPGMGTFDYDAGTVTFWGDGTQVIECTSAASTARMVARVATDPTVRSGKFAFAGDRISILDAAKVIERQAGQTFERKSLGTEADLRAAKAAAEKDPSDHFKPVMLAYQLYMLNGQTTLGDLQNDRYADVTLESFSDFAKRALPVAATA